MIHKGGQPKGGIKKFYGGHYLICLYDKDDEYLQYMFDNSDELGKFLHVPTYRISILVFKTRRNPNKVVWARINGKFQKLHLHLIDLYDNVDKTKKDIRKYYY